MIAALAAAAGVFYTGRSLEATRMQTAVAEQGQLTDRFTKAVDQLDRAGADHLQARLGGIYALERLARDSPRDHPTIVEVLTAFIRTTAHRPALGTAACPVRQDIASDVQAALTVLGRRNSLHDQTTQIDLRDTCLRNADLTYADLNNADFTYADLTEADLYNSDLTEADLYSAQLAGAQLAGADLVGAEFAGANLAGAILTKADLSGGSLSGAHLVGAYLMDTDLAGTNLAYADLAGADLTGATHDENTVLTGVLVNKDTQWWW